jgi:hypothetical protein
MNDARDLDDQGDLQAESLLQVLATAKGAGERMQILKLAVVAFDHYDVQSHNDVCISGGIFLVFRCLQLHYIEEQKDKDCRSWYFVLDAMCTLLSLLFRCDSNNGSIAFQNIGADLVSLLVCVINEFPEHSISTGPFQLVDRLTLLENVSIVRTRKASLLLRLIQQLIRDENGSSLSMQLGSRILLVLAKNSENCNEFVGHPSLLFDLASIMNDSSFVNSLLLDVVETLRYMSVNWSIKIELVRHENLIKGILNILGNEDSKANVKQAVLKIIQGLGLDTTCRTRLCSYDKGRILKVLFTATKSPSLRYDAIHGIVSLIDSVSGPKMIKRFPKSVRSILVSISVMLEPQIKLSRTEISKIGLSMTTSGSATVMDDLLTISANFLCCIARHITVSNDIHPEVIKALTQLASSTNPVHRKWAAKGFREHARTSSGRFFIARTSMVLDVLLILANDACRIVQYSATEALLWIVSDPINTKRFLHRLDVLETFVCNGKLSEKCINTCRAAIQAIITITNLETDLTKIAKTLGLVEVLTEYGISNDDEATLKCASLQCVLFLAPLM